MVGPVTWIAGLFFEWALRANSRGHSAGTGRRAYAGLALCFPERRHWQLSGTVRRRIYAVLELTSGSVVAAWRTGCWCMALQMSAQERAQHFSR